PHSPFARGLLRSQSGLKLALASAHVRLTLFTDAVIGLFALMSSTAITSTYRPSDALSAVLPLPNRSYDTPSRGFRSFQFGTPPTLSKLRAPTNCPAGTSCGGTHP